MDREFESKLDEISGAFERWAKEVADRIVEAAKSGAESAAQSHEATDSRSGFHEKFERDSSQEDPWREWARMRDETWSRWASGKFDKPMDADAVRQIYQEALNSLGGASVSRVFDGLFRQLEQVLRSATEATREAATETDKIAGAVSDYVDAEIEVVVEAGEPKTSKYARKLIAKIEQLDRKGKPKKMIKSLLSDLEADLKKLSKKSGKGRKK